MTVEPVARVRAFNRFYTRVIGVLGEGLLDTSYSLSEARVLFELAQADAVEVVDLRRGLGLDAGYLSRVLTRFETDGLLDRSRSAADGRRQVVALTEAGRAAARDIDARSRTEVGTLLEPLEEGQRRRLLGAMDAIQDVLGPAPRSSLVVLRPPVAGDLGWIVRRHGELYATAHGWDAGFEAYVARILGAFGAGPREALWIAEIDGAPVGSIMCARDDDETARLRILLVEPAVRGIGLGRRLVHECLRFARQAGYRRIVLSTYDAMAEARRIYERVGFRLASARPVHEFGADLVDEVWAMDLN
ncbi:MarR family transcriptional regulator with acetyltransferase activity [Asanoa ferruginea]|uniref:MarR family transcriptional regulator with acetyltransferase activity n=1 Tax=Asanoa ferruginea TaxID=53367 RepID=A0A3D9ZDN4_9ACTN|nr:helix-turn-helix domain-containing GNAT family N-acetyltransferase [Asanoa ferruginea]REF95431.1 MarR family transcriptional regulator with acetyltransferase activity [Asanoa ferruginea]GIF46700.1 MarR family transcriptional regulator [Asanoa ferruginea]